MVRVSKPRKEVDTWIVNWHEVKALWDTGAVTSAVTRKYAEIMKLRAREHALLGTAKGEIPTYKDIVLIELMINGLVLPVKVAVVDSIPGVGNDFLIGMDVIQCGEMTIKTDHSAHRFDFVFDPYPGLFRPMSQILI